MFLLTQKHKTNFSKILNKFFEIFKIKEKLNLFSEFLIKSAKILEIFLINPKKVIR